MASRASFFFTFQLCAVLLLAVSVAALSVEPQHGSEVSGISREKFELVDVSEFKTDPNSNELPAFQIAVQVKGKLEYLYAEGTKVLSTSNPDSVGTARTVWQAVPGFNTWLPQNALSFNLQNKDTGSFLYYDFKTISFYGAWVDSETVRLTNWRVWRSVEDPSRYKLQYITGRRLFALWPASDEWRIFHIVTEIKALLDMPHLIVPIRVGTKFQLTTLQAGREVYLYSEGEKVLTTADPVSVGTERTIWEFVQGLHLEAPWAFPIRNTHTGFVLRYNGEFYGEDVEGAPTGAWRLSIPIAVPLIYPPRPVHRLTYLPYSRLFIEGRFNYKPIKEGEVSQG